MEEPNKGDIPSVQVWPLRWPEPTHGECSQAGCEPCTAVPITATASPLGKDLLGPQPRDGAFGLVAVASEELGEQSPFLSSSRFTGRVSAEDEPATCIMPAKSSR